MYGVGVWMVFYEGARVPLQCPHPTTSYLRVRQHTGKIIGGTFVEVFQREAARVGEGCDFLAQGTLYPGTCMLFLMLVVLALCENLQW